MRNLWGAGLCLAAAIVLVLLSSRPAERVYNLDLSDPGIGDTYLIPHRTEVDRCFLVNRRDATMRRSDDNQPGRKWQCYEMAGAHSGRPTWLVRSKRKGKGTVFFVPVRDVSDWSYPFFYAFVRKARPALELPKVAWTQLFVNRLYQGLYLRVALPFDARKKDGGSGVLREILSIEGSHLSVVNSRFEEVRGLFNDAIAQANPPILGPQPAALVWLAVENDTPDLSFLMSRRAPHDLRLLPLPISLPRLYQLHAGHPPVRFEDARYLDWAKDWRPTADAPPEPFDAEEMAALRDGFDDYASAFVRALHADAERNDESERIAALMAKRQGTARGLGLSLAGAP